MVDFFGPSPTTNYKPPTANSPFAGFYTGLTGKKPAPAPAIARPTGSRPIGYATPRQADARVDRQNMNNANPQQDAGMSEVEALMSMIFGAGGGGGGGVSRAQIQAMQDRGAQDRARIEALYGSYAKMIGDRQPAITSNYEAGAKNLTDAYAQSGATNDAAYNAAREAQTRQLQQLGLTEMAPPTNTEAQVKAAQNNDALKQAAIAQQEASRQAAINQNISLQNAASREGTQQLGAFDQRLSDMINQMQSSGGGGGGGGGASASDIIRAYLGASELDLKRQDLETQKAVKAAELAAGGQSKDWASLYDQLVNTKGMDPKDALSLLGLYS